MRRLMAGLLLLVACGGSTEPKAKPWYQGTWGGVIGTGQTISLDMIEANGTVTGTGTLSRSTGPLAISVSGTYVPPNLNLTVNSGSLAPFNFKGTVNATTITATLNGSGFINDPVTLNRAGN